jgi:hypothetical protein
MMIFVSRSTAGFLFGLFLFRKKLSLLPTTRGVSYGSPWTLRASIFNLSLKSLEKLFQSK